MPRYTYVCLECEKEIESIHTLGEKIETCADISECTESAPVKKLFGVVNIHRPNTDASPDRVGATVKRFIEDSRKDLEQQKKEMKKETKK